jgi:hypothetical protein
MFMSSRIYFSASIMRWWSVFFSSAAWRSHSGIRAAAASYSARHPWQLFATVLNAPSRRAGARLAAATGSFNPLPPAVIAGDAEVEFQGRS